MSECGVQGCIDGFIYDPYKKVKTICPECAKRRELEVVDGTAVRKLGLPIGFSNSHFDVNTVISDQDKEKITQESFERVQAGMQQVMNSVIRGDVPDVSVLFYLGRTANVSNFLNPFILKAYLSGIKVTPVIDSATLCRLRLWYDGYFDKEEHLLREFEGTNVESYVDFVNSDLCVVYMDAGTTLMGFNTVKGLVQLRARKGLSTIVVADVWMKLLYDLCIHQADYEGKYPMVMCAVKYNEEHNEDKSTQKPKSNARMSRDEFSKLKREQNHNVY